MRSGNLDRAYNLLKNPMLFPPPPLPQPGRDAGSATAAEEAGTDAGGVEGTSPGGAGKEAGLVRPSVEAFTSVLTGFAGVGDKDRALAVFQQVLVFRVSWFFFRFLVVLSLLEYKCNVAVWYKGEHARRDRWVYYLLASPTRR